MKRVGGQVTWLVEFAPWLAELIRTGEKRQTLRRCRIVEPGDTLRLADAGSGAVGGEVTVTWTARIELCQVLGAGGVLEGYAMALDGLALTYPEMDVVARADGFGCVEDLGGWLATAGKFANGTYQGQLIGW